VDTTAPLKPTGLTEGIKTRSGVSATVTLTWTQPSDDTADETSPGTTNAMRYRIYINGVAILSGLNPLTVNTNSYTVTGLRYKTQYKFTVTAVDLKGNVSAQSDLITVATADDDQKPSTPDGLLATQMTSTTYNLSWNASTDDIGVVSYEVSAGSTVLGTTTAPKTSLVVKLPPGSTSVSVIAIDAKGNESIAGTLVVEVPVDAQNPEAPQGLTAVYDAGATTVTLSWLAAYDNNAVVKYIIKNDVDSAVEVTPTGSPATLATTTSVPASFVDGKTIYVVAVDGNGNESTNNFKLKVDAPTGSAIGSEVTSIQFSGITTRAKTTIFYKTTTSTKMRVRIYRDSDNDGVKDTTTGSPINSLTETTVSAGSKSITLNLPAKDDKYIIEYTIKSSDDSKIREYNVVYIVDRTLPDVKSSATSAYTITASEGEGSTTDIQYTVSENAIVTAVIQNSKKTVVRTIRTAERLLKTESGSNYTFTWNGKNESGANVPDGVYTLVFSSVDTLGNKGVTKTSSITIERNKPVVTLVTTNVKSGSNLTINYSLSEAATITALQLCSNAPEVGALDSEYVCTAIPNAVIAGTGLQKDGINKFTIKLPSTSAVTNGSTYYLVIKASDLTKPTAKTNDTQVFALKVDSTPPKVIGLEATNVSGTGSSTIKYHLDENVRVTVAVKFGTSYSKSKVIRTLVNNVLTANTDDTDDSTKVSVTWDGKDDKGKNAANTTATTKYFIEVRVSDLSGNTNTLSTTGEFPSVFEITKS
jgi:hypothetical protein